MSKIFKTYKPTEDTIEIAFPTFDVKIPLDIAHNPSSSQIIFQSAVENSVAEEVIKQRLNELLLLCESEGGDFLYLPEYVQSLFYNNKGIYNNPAQDWDINTTSVNWNTFLLDNIKSGTYIKQPCLLVYNGCDHTTKENLFHGILLESDNEDEIISRIKWFCCNFSYDCNNSPDQNVVRYRAITDFNGVNSIPTKKSADETFSADVENMIKSARECVNKLRFTCIDELILHELVFGEPKLSRLVVTKDKKIILPDYNNMEIKMSPLPKAVYLLFLNHPEGILLKNMEKYYRELWLLYKETTDRTDISYLTSSLNMLVDPMNNSINEKCARIKESFLKNFNDELAQYYYISSEGIGKPKKILLDRGLVEMQ